MFCRRWSAGANRVSPKDCGTETELRENPNNTCLRKRSIIGDGTIRKFAMGSENHITRMH